MPERVCEICGAVFWSRSLAKTCSYECNQQRKKIRNAAYRAAHRDELKEYLRVYYQEVTKPVQKELYAQHKEALKARYEKHKDERNARRRARYAGDGERIRQQNAAWREKNREIKREIDRKYRAKHREALAVKAKLRRRFAGFKTETVVVDGQKFTLFHCERLNCKMTTLPCGDRWQCWNPEPCSLVPKGKPPLRYGEGRIASSWWQQSKVKPTFNETEDEI